MDIVPDVLAPALGGPPQSPTQAHIQAQMQVQMQILQTQQELRQLHEMRQAEQQSQPPATSQQQQQQQRKSRHGGAAGAGAGRTLRQHSYQLRRSAKTMGAGGAGMAAHNPHVPRIPVLGRLIDSDAIHCAHCDATLPLFLETAIEDIAAESVNQAGCHNPLSIPHSDGITYRMCGGDEHAPVCATCWDLWVGLAWVTLLRNRRVPFLSDFLSYTVKDELVSDQIGDGDDSPAAASAAAAETVEPVSWDQQQQEAGKGSRPLSSPPSKSAASTASPSVLAASPRPEDTDGSRPEDTDAVATSAAKPPVRARGGGKSKGKKRRKNATKTSASRPTANRGRQKEKRICLIGYVLPWHHCKHFFNNARKVQEHIGPNIPRMLDDFRTRKILQLPCARFTWSDMAKALPANPNALPKGECRRFLRFLKYRRAPPYITSEQRPFILALLAVFDDVDDASPLYTIKRSLHERYDTLLRQPAGMPTPVVPTQTSSMPPAVPMAYNGAVDMQTPYTSRSSSAPGSALLPGSDPAAENIFDTLAADAAASSAVPVSLSMSQHSQHPSHHHHHHQYAGGSRHDARLLEQMMDGSQPPPLLGPGEGSQQQQQQQEQQHLLHMAELPAQGSTFPAVSASTGADMVTIVPPSGLLPAVPNEPLAAAIAANSVLAATVAEHSLASVSSAHSLSTSMAPFVSSDPASLASQTLAAAPLLSMPSTDAPLVSLGPSASSPILDAAMVSFASSSAASLAGTVTSALTPSPLLEGTAMPPVSSFGPGLPLTTLSSLVSGLADAAEPLPSSPQGLLASASQSMLTDPLVSSAAAAGTAPLLSPTISAVVADAVSSVLHSAASPSVSAVLASSQSLHMSAARTAASSAAISELAVSLANAAHTSSMPSSIYASSAPMPGPGVNLLPSMDPTTTTTTTTTQQGLDDLLRRVGADPSRTADELCVLHSRPSIFLHISGHLFDQNLMRDILKMLQDNGWGHDITHLEVGTDQTTNSWMVLQIMVKDGPMRASRLDELRHWINTTLKAVFAERVDMQELTQPELATILQRHAAQIRK